MTTSLRRADLLALSNLRNDGRKPEEIRRLRVQMGCLGGGGGVSGSALIEMGLTIAVACVRGPMECQRRSDELSDRAILEVVVRTAPFGNSGTDRRIVNPNTDRRLLEISTLVQRAMEASILVHLHPKSRICINITILADDGGRLCAAINAATLAVMDAGIPMKDFCVACSAGVAAATASGGGVLDDTTTLVDLNRREESSTGGQPAVVMPCAILPQRGTIVLAQCEARVPSIDLLQQVQAAAMDGCRAVFDILQAAVRERATTLLSARKGGASISNAFS